MTDIDMRDRRRPRVLVEAPPHPWHYIIKDAQTLFSCDVSVCGGPLCTGEPCPVAEGRECAKAAEADVVIAGLGLDTDVGCSILEGLRDVYPETPIVVPVWRVDTTRHVDLLSGCRLVVFPWTIPRFTTAVREALASNADK